MHCNVINMMLGVFETPLYYFAAQIYIQFSYLGIFFDLYLI